MFALLANWKSEVVGLRGGASRIAETFQSR